MMIIGASAPKGDQTEAVEHRIAAADGHRQADPERRQQRRGNRGRDDPAGIEGQANQFWRRKPSER
jgi:hypothetical protein